MTEQPERPSDDPGDDEPEAVESLPLSDELLARVREFNARCRTNRIGRGGT